MSVIEKLASSLGRRDEVPNQELAQEIVAKKNKKAVQELVEHLSAKSKDIQNDCIKTLYEIGERAPSLIAPYTKEFIALLDHKNNRLQWGAMTALGTITMEDPKAIYAALPKIVDAAENGTVITKDHAMKILTSLGAVKQYAEDAFALIVEQLLISPTNQLPTYAENALPLVNDKNKAAFLNALTSRISDVESETKRKRLEKVIKKLSK